MQLTPYLTFNGQCAQAFQFYERCLGGELKMQRHGESPIADQVPPSWHDLVLHAYLQVGDAVLMGSDGRPDQPEQPGGFSVSVTVEDAGEVDRIFNALSERGTVIMPAEETFWAKRFGMLTDRFGVRWMVNCYKAP